MAPAAPAPDARVAGIPHQDAAAYLCTVSGVGPEHFGRIAEADQSRLGADALASRCRYVDLASPPPADLDLPRWRREDVAAYGGAGWRGHLSAQIAAYLTGGERTFHSPVHGVPVRVLGEAISDAYQLHVAVHADELCFFGFVGRMMQGVYYPRRDLFVRLRPTHLPLTMAVRHSLRVMLSKPPRFARFLERASAGSLRRAFVIGDVRPGHFVRESLAYIDAAEAELRGFIDRGGLIVTIREWCAMDPLAAFPMLAQGDVLTLGAAQASGTLLDFGIDAHRVHRFKAREDGGWLRSRLARLGRLPEPASSSAARFRVLISIDAEKRRILNQVEAFRFVLRRLGAACAARGMALEVVWDGWTVRGTPNDKDRQVMARIEATIAAILEEAPVPASRQFRIFGRSSDDKVGAVAECDLVLVTQGTGAVVPSWLLSRPTIVYHVARAVAVRSDVCEKTVTQMDQRAVIEPPPDPAQPDAARFSLALWGLDDALVRAVGPNLGLKRELPGPPTDQASTNAGTA